MSTATPSSKPKIVQGTLFDTPEPDIGVEPKTKKKASFSQELGLIEDLKRRIGRLERELADAREERTKAWDRATDALEAEQFLRRLAQFMKRYMDDFA